MIMKQMAINVSWHWCTWNVLCESRPVGVCLPAGSGHVMGDMNGMLQIDVHEHVGWLYCVLVAGHTKALNSDNSQDPKCHVMQGCEWHVLVMECHADVMKHEVWCIMTCPHRVGSDSRFGTDKPKTDGITQNRWYLWNRMGTESILPNWNRRHHSKRNRYMSLQWNRKPINRKPICWFWAEEFLNQTT